MSNLTQEPTYDEGLTDSADLIAAKAHADKYPDHPLPLAGGVVRIACPGKKEYISSAAFSNDATLVGAWAQPYGIGTALQLLTMRKGALGAPHDLCSIIGRWWANSGITTSFKYDSPKSHDWVHVGIVYDDISKLVLKHMDKVKYHFRRPWPTTFRQMIYAYRTPDTDDLSWMTVDDMWAMREQCKRMEAGTWTRMRKWLMRQQLADDVRRALGGRPGRLLENQRQTRDSREYRRVRTDRKKEGTHAARGNQD